MRRPANSAGDASQRHLLYRVAGVALVLRHSTNCVVGAAGLVDAGSLRPTGQWVFAVLGCWAVYRLATRSQRPAVGAVDFVLTMSVCLAVPVLVASPDFDKAFSAPVLVAWSAVTSFAGQYDLRRAIPMTMCVTGAYAVGAAQVLGWARMSQVDAIIWVLLSATATMLFRSTLRAAAARIDRARAIGEDAELARNVSVARSNYQREQLATLHDTAASTLLLVDQQTSIPPSRLAAQARRDLEFLNRNPMNPSQRINLAAAARGCAEHSATPVQLEGRNTVWVDELTAHAVTGAVREALTNVDRHADGSMVTITMLEQSVTVRDDGIGFGPQAVGQGITRSIIGRMRRAGGAAEVSSVPGRGTVITLSWHPPTDPAASLTSVHPDHLVRRMWQGWGLALVLYAVVTIVARNGHWVLEAPHQVAGVALAVVALVSSLAAVPGILYGRWWPAWPAAAALLAVTVIQPLLGTAQFDRPTLWSHTSIGCCLVPLLLGLRFRIAAAVQAAFWLVDTAINAALQPPQLIGILCLGAATNLIPGLAALMLNRLLSGAAAEARREGERQLKLRTTELITEAIRTEYQSRYADVVADVASVLTALSGGERVTAELRGRARTQSRRLRSLLEDPVASEHPLMRALHQIIDDARGANVDVQLAGELPDLAEDEIARLVAPVACVLSEPIASARVALLATGTEVIASVVCEASEVAGALTPLMGLGDEAVEVVITDRSAWLKVCLELDEELDECARDCAGEYVSTQRRSA